MFVNKAEIIRVSIVRTRWTPGGFNPVLNPLQFILN